MEIPAHQATDEAHAEASSAVQDSPSESSQTVPQSAPVPSEEKRSEKQKPASAPGKVKSSGKGKGAPAKEKVSDEDESESEDTESDENEVPQLEEAPAGDVLSKNKNNLKKQQLSFVDCLLMRSFSRCEGQASPELIGWS